MEDHNSGGCVRSRFQTTSGFMVESWSLQEVALSMVVGGGRKLKAATMAIGGGSWKRDKFVGAERGARGWVGEGITWGTNYVYSNQQNARVLR